jgi:hypothetical protein
MRRKCLEGTRGRIGACIDRRTYRIRTAVAEMFRLLDLSRLWLPHWFSRFEWLTEHDPGPSERNFFVPDFFKVVILM